MKFQVKLISTDFMWDISNTKALLLTELTSPQQPKKLILINRYRTTVWSKDSKSGAIPVDDQHASTSADVPVSAGRRKWPRRAVRKSERSRPPRLYRHYLIFHDGRLSCFMVATE